MPHGSIIVPENMEQKASYPKASESKAYHFMWVEMSENLLKYLPVIIWTALVTRPLKRLVAIIATSCSEMKLYTLLSRTICHNQCMIKGVFSISLFQVS